MIFHVGSDNGCVITKMLEETLFRSCGEAQSPPRLILSSISFALICEKNTHKRKNGRTSLPFMKKINSIKTYLIIIFFV